MKTNAKIALALFAVSLCTQSVAALNAEEMVSALEPDKIESLARGFGSATLKKERDGEPYIIGLIDGTKYGIYFYGCEDGRECQSIQFSAGWTDANVTMDTINRWNRDKRFGKAYLDKEGDPRIEMDVNLDYGVTTRNFEDTFDLWSRVLKSFKTDFLD